MGTGKTAVGKILAQKLGERFVEMDAVIEERAGKPIVDIFAQDGEAKFRQLEQSLLKELSQKTDLVVSCGGGLICNDDNLKILKETGTVFNLKSSPARIWRHESKTISSSSITNIFDCVTIIWNLFNGL